MPKPVSDFRTKRRTAIYNSIDCGLSWRVVGYALLVHILDPLFDRHTATENPIECLNFLRERVAGHGFDHRSELVEVIAHRFLLVASAPLTRHRVYTVPNKVEHLPERLIRGDSVGSDIEVLGGHGHDVGQDKACVLRCTEPGLRRGSVISDHRILDLDDVNRALDGGRVPVKC